MQESGGRLTYTIIGHDPPPPVWRCELEKKSELDLQWVRKEAEQHSSLKLILYCPNWLQLWNLALDTGPHGTRCGQCLVCTLTKPIFSNRQCSKCCNTIVQEVYLDRLFHNHADQLNVKETYNVVIQELLPGPAKLRFYIE